MTIMKYVLLAAMAVTLLWLWIRLLRQKERGKTFFGSMLWGLVSLVCVYIFGRFQGELLQINLYTLTTASVLGIPGVILMVLIHLLWQL
jgi:pro-sigmaK processing inhibitor BofA